jgi:aspartyl-tRNA(Asn)/glutamyl-tRNA(Gln) amidotransferase subunit A
MFKPALPFYKFVRHIRYFKYRIFPIRFYSYRPKRYQSERPADPLPYYDFFERETKNDEISYASIAQLNSLLRTKKITIPEVANVVKERQNVLEKFNFIVSDTHNLTTTESLVLHRKYEELPFNFFTYGLKDTTTMCRGDVLTTDGSLLNSLYGVQRGFSHLARILEDKQGLFIGTTSLPEFGHKSDTVNRVIGLTRNPHNPNLTIGGSSGGSAGVVATGIAQVAFATDGAGSIVIPAAFAGVVGVKPSGVILQPFDSFTPLKLGFGPGTTCKGWFSRTVEDSAMLVDFLSGNRSHTVDNLNPNPFPTYRIAYLPKFDYCNVDEAISQSISSAVQKLEHILQIRLTEKNTLGFPDPSWAADVHWLSTYASFHTELGKKWEKLPNWESLLDASTLKVMKEGKNLTKEIIVKSAQERDSITVCLDKFFEEWDFLITPATPTLPWEAGEPRPKSYEGHARSAHTPFSYVFNYSCNPSVVLPCSIVRCTEHLAVPVGLQIVASKRISLLQLLQMAKKCETAFGYYKPIRFEGLSLATTLQPVDICVGSVTPNLDCTVKKFKEIVEKIRSITVDRLVFNNEVLDEDKSLLSYCITPNSHILACPKRESNFLAY